MQWHDTLDLVRNELQNAVIQNLSGPPASPKAGQVYFDTTLMIYRGWDGTAWINLSSLGTTDHGDLAGLADDDHTQYALADGTRGDFEPTGSSAAAVSAHEAAADPHAQYLTQAEGDGLYEDDGAVAAHAAAVDPHSQYQTTTEVNNQIDGRVTKTFVDALNIDADTLDGINSTAFERTTNKGSVNGYASLDGSGKIPQAQIPSVAISETFVVASQAAMLALTAQEGDVAVRTDESKSYILMGNDPSVAGDWQELLSPSDGVQSVSGSAPIASSGGNNPTISLNAGGVGTTHIANLAVTEGKLATAVANKINAAARKVSANVGDGAASSIAVTHNLGTRDVQVEVFDAASFKTIGCGITRNTTNQVTLTFGDYVPAAGEFRVVVTG